MSQNNTIDVNIFYGPSNKMGIEYKISSLPPYITLLQLASRLDSARILQNSRLLNFEEKILVVWPEEFFGVKDNFTNSFWRNILETNLEKVYIANPPLLLVEQARLLGLNVSERRFKYKKVNLELVRKSEAALKKELLGQDNAILQLTRCLTALMNSQKKPVVIMLYGPAGVGKTESAKIIANSLGGVVSRLQFSMLQTNSFAEYLYGSRINNRSFAANLLERQSNVVVFDEFDKTNVAFHSAFYQLFDEGIFVDKNYSVDMSNTLIICTSNYSSPQEIQKHLGEPLTSRFTAFIKYEALSRSAKEEIIKRKIEQLYDSYPKNIRSSIDKSFIEEKFMNPLLEVDNVREITNHIQYVMAEMLLRTRNSDN